MKERWCIVLLSVLWTLPGRAQQDALTHPLMAVVAKPTSISASRAIRECPTNSGGDRDQLEVEVPADSVTMTCSVERVSEVGQADDAAWRAVKYLTRYVFPADSIKRLERGAVTDTAEVFDVVLYSGTRGGTEWRGEWQVWADRRMTRDVDVTVGVHGGRAVFSVLSCVNGTGGCEQHFVARAKGRWFALSERYYAQLTRRFGTSAFMKGVAVDVGTLQGIVPLYAAGDANCCASRRLRLRLVVRDTEVVLAGASVSKQ